jgi:chromosome partitioning protein
LSEAATSFNSLGVLALPYVGQRNDHQDAVGAGLGVTEFAQEGRASDEVRELWRWVLKKLVEGSLDHEQHAKKAAC